MKTKSRLIPLLVLIFVGCSAAPLDTLPSPTEFSSPSPPPPTATLESTALLTTTEATAPQTSVPSCQFEGVGFNEKDVIDLSTIADLQWSTLQDSVSVLAGLTYPVDEITPSPDNQRLVVTLDLGNRYQLPLRAFALINLQGNDHRLLNGYYSGVGPTFSWLNDSRLLWIDQSGAVWIEAAREAQNLNAPEPMQAVWYLSNNTAFALPQNYASPPWKMDINGGEWRQVISETGEEMQAAFYHPSTDRTYVIAMGYGFSGNSEFAAGHIWRIPADLDIPAQLVTEFSGVEVLATDALIDPPQQLDGTSYWLHHQLFLDRGPVLDETTGAFLTLSDLPLTIPTALYRHGLYASPDGKWAAVVVAETPSTAEAQPTGIYLAPSDNLAVGQLFKGASIAGWFSDGALLYDRLTSQYLSVHLPSGESHSVDSGILIGNTANSVIMTDSELSGVLTHYDQQGRLLTQLDLSPAYNQFTHVAGTKTTVYLGATRGIVQGSRHQCTFEHGLLWWNAGG